MNKPMTFLTVLLGAALFGLALFLFRPFLRYPAPAPLQCVSSEAGQMEPLGDPNRVFGLGLSFAGHIAESPGLYDPEAGPPIFQKRARSINRTDRVPYPSREDLLEAAGRLDPEHARQLDREITALPPLLDYEVEIGLVVLRPFSAAQLSNPNFAPPLGFFVANDLTARILIGMAPEFTETVSYLAEGKGLPGFLPVGEKAFVPDQPEVDGWVCVEMKTEVNGEIRQQASSTDIIYSPRAILKAVAERESITRFESHDWIITGTPPGVALQTPAWLQRTLLLLDPPAKTKVSAMAGGAEESGFLKPGDRIRVSAGFLGEKVSRIAD
jgi:2-keto-4-pentenoate hydratase/2-oxohepta-3-ene-1,7-dioic acid hydratase in catechol pathway